MMSDFEDDFTKAIKEIDEMLNEFTIEKKLEILTKYTGDLILQQKKWNKGK